MVFTVTYRGRDGGICEEAVEAASRAECMAACRTRGITPTSIREGRSGKSVASPDGSARSPSASLTWKVAVIAAVVLAVAGGVWCWLALRADARASNTERTEPNHSMAARTEPRKHDSTNGVPAKAHMPKAATLPKPISSPEGATPPPKEEVLSVVTNKSGYIVERVRNPDGTTTRRISSPPPVFRNVSDQMIALSLSGQPGQSLPPMPANAVSDEDFRKSLEEEIVILDTDPPEVKDLKARVIVAREDIKAMMKKGYSVQQVLEEHHRLFNDNAKLHSDAVVELKAILNSGDREGARKYAEKINEAFRQIGVPEITVPSKDGAEEEASKAARKEAIRERAKQRKEK